MSLDLFHRAIVDDGWKKYATWNPDQLGGVVLSNNNKTVTRTAGLGPCSSCWANATFPHSSGKWYWEIFMQGSHGSLNHRQGITDQIGSAGAGSLWSYQSIGSKNCHGGDTSFELPGYNGGDVIQVAADLEAGRIWFGLNGTFAGDPAAGTNPACSFSPSISMRIRTQGFGDGVSITLRANPADIEFENPVGFAKGWYL